MEINFKKVSFGHNLEAIFTPKFKAMILYRAGGAIFTLMVKQGLWFKWL